MIHPQTFITPPNSAGSAGGTVLFFGTIRCDRTPQQRVTHLVYEAYESLADQMIDDLISKTLRVWPVLGAKVLHRLGTVGIGETAVAIEVRSAHRDEAYQASRFLIDQIKKGVPIWKKEYFEDGLYRWGRCEHGGRESQPVVSEALLERKDIKIFTPKRNDQCVIIQMK